MGVYYSKLDESDYFYEKDVLEKYHAIINSDLSLLRIWFSLFNNNNYVIKVRADNVFYCECPFHKSSDFSVCINENNKAFFCYGCGIGGTVVTLISEFFNIDKKDAVKILYAYINHDVESLTQDELKILSEIFSNYSSNKVDKYFAVSKAKTVYLNSRIERYIRQNSLRDNTYNIISKMSKRLCCSQDYVRELKRN